MLGLAFRRAYGIVSALALFFLLYLAIATDSQRIDLWRPGSYSDWSGILWVMVVWTYLLPATVLAWQSRGRARA